MTSSSDGQRVCELEASYGQYTDAWSASWQRLRDEDSHTVAAVPRVGDIASDESCTVAGNEMSWALDEFFAAVEEEFGVPIVEADDTYLETPGSVIDFVVDNSEPSDGMTDEEHRDHIAGVVGEIMARTLGITRYSERSRFVQDLRVR